ncbi:YggL family protein [Candidatus Arsenophonus nilaparvatae]|uniref:YggL family protein n=1 Tax=Candidatus Arsenophonus nilaparvatae TaxID=1247023 RepID=UPI0005095D9E|nr:YggL family protein [Candidatus Arsenophonus nilaparvatae]
MSKQRSRRLRKKLHIDEFQEVGFSVNWSFPAKTPIDKIDSMVDTFIIELIQPNGLAMDASGYLDWEGLICMEKTGKCTEEHRKLVDEWLKNHGMKKVVTSELFDIWWD